MTEDEYIAKLRLIRDELLEEHRRIAAQDPSKYPKQTLREIRSMYRIFGTFEELGEEDGDAAASPRR